MTIQEYKQQIYDACREHIFLAQQALDRYATAKTDREQVGRVIPRQEHCEMQRNRFKRFQ